VQKISFDFFIENLKLKDLNLLKFFSFYFLKKLRRK